MSFYRLVFAAVSDSGPSVTLTSISNIQDNPGLYCKSGVKFQSDGQLVLLGPLIGSETNETGEWLDSIASGNGDGFDVRCTSMTGDAWTTEAAAEDSWVQVNSDRSWFVVVAAMASPDLKDVTCTFEIRPHGGGTTLASVSCECIAQN